MSLRVCVAGASGRMGRALIEQVLAAPDLTLAAALDRPASPAIGRDAGELSGVRSGVTVQSDVRAALSASEVLLDFTRPEGTLAHLAACRALGVKAVVGTTGFADAGKLAIAEAAREVAIVCAPNMSVGVNVTVRLLELAAKALGPEYDIEVIEAHHKHKVDAPSGTALMMGQVLAEAMGSSLGEAGVFAREGATGERRPGSIGFAMVRGGDIVGDHTVLFAGTGERVEITHRATSRANFAGGALRAARFVAGQANGLFDMRDVLGLR